MNSSGFDWVKIV